MELGKLYARGPSEQTPNTTRERRRHERHEEAHPAAIMSNTATSVSRRLATEA